MSQVAEPQPVIANVSTVSPEKTLRRLFLLVFMRGQSARGLTKESAPRSLLDKMLLILLVYGAMGLFSLFLVTQKVLVQSVFLHAMTFMAVGMFVATSSGEALFNKEESEILMHRPVTPQMLLRAKAAVLIQVSLYLALAINFVGFFAGLTASDGSWLYPFAHALSTLEEALFCTAVVVLAYQFCLRFFGKERLDGIMTTMQVLVVLCAFIGSQVLPRAIIGTHGLSVNFDAWWIKVLPPAWFASLDDAIAGGRSGTSWLLAGVGLVVCGLALWAAFGKLAAVYETGSQTLNEGPSARPEQRVRFSRLKRLTELPPLSWVLRDIVSRASFLLVAAYMARDRDVKLRLYPGIAPAMMMPVVMFVTNHGTGRLSGGFGDFFVALASSYLCIVPLSALNLLRYSQQWRAAEVFLAAPIAGPAALLTGARVAVLLFMSLPMVALLFGYVLLFERPATLLLLLPGVIALPVYAMIPAMFDNAVPLSNPQEEAKSLNSFPILMVSAFGSFGIAGAAVACAAAGWFSYFLVVETAAAVSVCMIFRTHIAKRSFRVYD